MPQGASLSDSCAPDRWCHHEKIEYSMYVITTPSHNSTVIWHPRHPPTSSPLSVPRASLNLPPPSFPSTVDLPRLPVFSLTNLRFEGACFRVSLHSSKGQNRKCTWLHVMKNLHNYMFSHDYMLHHTDTTWTSHGQHIGLCNGHASTTRVVITWVHW